jgi:ribonuclease HI
MSGSGDLAYALKLLASGQSLAEASLEAGFGSRRALAESMYELADRVKADAGKPAAGKTAAGRAAAGKVGGRKVERGVLRANRDAAGGEALRLIAYSDGASIGNPGEAGCGALLVDETGQVLLEDYRYLGKTTNNVAEYEGAILALDMASRLGAGEVELRVDSDLLANQISGRYKVKSSRLAHLYEKLKNMTELFEDFSVTRVGRNDNRQADRLANLAISSRKRR